MKEITFTVAECSEYKTMGELHEGIETIEEAIKLYHSIDPTRMNGIPCISINFHEPGTEDYMDDEANLLIAGRIESSSLGLFLDAENANEPKLLNAIEVLKKEFPQEVVR